MPFALLFVGIILLVAGVRAKQDDLYATVKGDFSGDSNFVGWMVSILIIGALGYIEPIRPVSRAFIALIVVGLFLRNGGVFQKFNEQVFAKPSSPQSGAGVTVTSNSFQNAFAGAFQNESQPSTIQR